MSEVKRIREKLAVLDTPGSYEMIKDILLFKGSFPYTDKGIELMVKELKLEYLKRLRNLLPENPKQTTIFDGKDS